MIIKAQRFLKKYIGYKWAYRVVYYSYGIVTLIPILVIGYLFKCIPFILISLFAMNILRRYTYGFHCDNNLQCNILSWILLPTFGYISKTIPMEWSFIFTLISMRYIYQKAPLKLTIEDKDIKWHRKWINRLMVLYFILALVLVYFNLQEYASDILWSLVMVALTLFKNVNE